MEGVQSSQRKEVAAAVQELTDLFQRRRRIAGQGHQFLLETFYSLQGHSLVIGAIRTWSHESGIQQSLCCLITRILSAAYSRKVVTAASGSLSYWEIMESFHMAGAMEVILEAVKKYPTNLLLQLCGWAALGNLFSIEQDRYDGKSNQPEVVKRRAAAKRLVQDFSSIPFLVNVMVQFKDEEAMLEAGTFVLGRLGSLGQASSYNMKKHATFAVSLAVNTFPRNNTVGKYAKKLVDAALHE